jgi:hypothetical protein
VLWLLAGLCFANDRPPPDAWPQIAVSLVVATAIACVGGVGMARRKAKERAEWRRQRGQCPACGYDLTGNVSGVCPECGGGQ